jgi:alpha-beta hydrolase superfamily lysophospholipase
MGPGIFTADQYGSGPPLVLVHGAFSAHQANWAFVKPLLEPQFTVSAIARRGRGETDGTAGHSLEDESRDVVAVMQSIGAPVFLLGHSYGAQTALAAVLPNARIEELPGQAHEGTTTAPPDVCRGGLALSALVGVRGLCRPAHPRQGCPTRRST